MTIAAITSCTNTSNPSVMLAAGLLARNAVKKGLKAKPWVKTTLAPGSKVVTDYYEKAGLTQDLEDLGFYTVGYGCTTCIGNSGPLIEEVSAAVQQNDLAVTAVLSGNRNFEGRINPDVKMNYLASPPLVIAYSLAGSMNFDFETDPLGKDQDGNDVFLRTSGRTRPRCRRRSTRRSTRTCSTRQYASVFEGDERWKTLPTPTGDVFEWDAESTYVRKPPYFDGMTMELTPVTDIAGARVLATLGDSVTTDHISPAGNIKADSPAGHYLDEHGVDRKDYNSYGSRRGNHEVMIRGTFANIRLRNQLLDGVEGGFTRDFTQEGGPQSFIYDASQNYQAAGHPAGDLRRQGVRLRLVARLGGQGHEPAGRQGGHHRELRADPPLEPHRHGRRPAAVPGGRELGLARPRRHRDRLDLRPRAAERGRHAQDGPRHGRPERVLRAGQARRSSSTRSCASTRPARPTTTATAASCSTCCARSSERYGRGRVACARLLAAYCARVDLHEPVVARKGAGCRCCRPSPDPAISTR